MLTGQPLQKPPTWPDILFFCLSWKPLQPFPNDCIYLSNQQRLPQYVPPKQGNSLLRVLRNLFPISPLATLPKLPLERAYRKVGPSLFWGSILKPVHKVKAAKVLNPFMRNAIAVRVVYFDGYAESAQSPRRGRQMVAPGVSLGKAIQFRRVSPLERAK
jgi:hypothetical protein